MRSEIVEAIKPVIKNARETAIRLQAEQVASRAQYTADVDQAIATDIAAWLASAGMMVVPGWQPIESAPREIEFRCLLAHQYSMVIGYWDGEGWRNERSRVGSYFQATHWMPLPASPLQNGEVG